MAPIDLPRGYGYVFGVLGASFFMVIPILIFILILLILLILILILILIIIIRQNAYLSINVSIARKKYNCQYPNLYMIALTDKDKKEADEFNSIQRAHQNTLGNFENSLLFKINF